MAEETGPNSGIIIAAGNGAHVDTIGTMVLGIAFLIVLAAYMRLQGRYRRLLERIAKED